MTRMTRVEKGSGTLMVASCWSKEVPWRNLNAVPPVDGFNGGQCGENILFIHRREVHFYFDHFVQHDHFGDNF